MDYRKWLGTVLCTLAAWVLSSVVVLGQSSPTTENQAAGVGVDTPPLSSDLATCELSCAGCCEESCCQLPDDSCWTVVAEFICFERVASVHQTLVSTYPPHNPLVPGTGFERLNAADLDQGFAGGTRLGLVRHVDNDSDVEISFFQINEWSSVGDIAPNYLGPFAPPPNWLTFLAPGDFVQLTDHPDQHMVWTYRTRLHNAELNLRQELSPRVTVLAGLRWVNLWEELQGTLPPQREVPFWDAKTNNNLYGLQVGGEWRMLNRSCFSLDGLVKAGLFDNVADENAAVSIYRVLHSESDSTNHAAFLGQVGLRCNVQLTQRLLLKAGYEALWLGGVALAPAQISRTVSHSVPVTDVYVTSLGIDSTSVAFFHGATVGMEYAF